MDRSKLIIGAYYFDKSLWDDEHIKQVADAGIQFLVGVPAEQPLLDLCEKYGIKIIATSTFPCWWGGTGETGGTYCKSMPFEKFDEIAENYKRHPAIWGDYPIDEPNDKDFDYMGRIISRYCEKLPGLLPFINLHPYYEDIRCTAWLGAPYRKYLAEYLGYIPNDYVAFDIYPYSNRQVYTPTFLYGFDINADACRRAGRDLWVIVQAGAWKPEDMLDEYQLRLQVNIALTYGARCIMYASWSKGWWNETTACVNTAGERNPMSYYVENVNKELRAISDVYMRYRNFCVTSVGNIDIAGADVAPQLHEIRRINAELYGRKEFDICDKIRTDGALLCGCFEDGKGGRAVMLTNIGNIDSPDADASVSLGFDGEIYINGSRINGNEFILRSGDAAFVIVKK